MGRSSHEDCELAGSLTLSDRTNAKVREIFEIYESKPTDDSLDDFLEA